MFLFFDKSTLIQTKHLMIKSLKYKSSIKSINLSKRLIFQSHQIYEKLNNKYII